MYFYNVESPIRDFSLSIMVVIIFVALQFVITYIYQWTKSPYRKISDLRFSWSIFLLSIMANIFFYIISDFYTIGEERMLFLRLGSSALLIGLAIFANIQERALPYRTRNIFGFLGIVMAILIFFIPPTLFSILQYLIIGVPYSLLFILFIGYIWKQTIGPFRKKVYSFVFGFIVGLIGYVFLTDYLVNVLGHFVYTFGTIFVLSSVFIMSVSIMGMPSFAELNWSQKINDIYLIHKSGMPLFHINMKRKEETDVKDKEVLTGGALTVINMVLQSIVKSGKEIKSIDQENVKLLFGHSSSIILVILAEEDLEILHYKIKQFFKDFFELYGTVPEDIYNRSTFLPARALAMKIFSEEAQKLEEKR